MIQALPSRRSRLQRTLRKMLSQWQLYLLILPAVVYLILFDYMPMYGLQIAFKDFRASKGIWGSPWVGLKHFIRFVNYPNFWTLLGNTASISLYTLATFPLAIVVALMINELDSLKFKKTVQMVTYAPHFISTVVVCSMVTLFFGRGNGLVNNVRELLGFGRFAYMESPSAFRHIYVWSGVWQNLGWNTILYIAALSNVAPELVEAARIDGATRAKIVWHVNIPTILPTIIITLIMRCGSVLSVGFEKIFLLQNPLNLSASQVISTYVYEIGLAGGQFSYSSAIGLFNTAINILLLVIVNTISKRVSEVSLW